MTTLSIPERAREIAERLAEKLYPMYCEHFNGMFCDVCAPKLIAKTLKSAMRSERELCAKELEAEARPDAYFTFTDAAKLLRDGGK